MSCCFVHVMVGYVSYSPSIIVQIQQEICDENSFWVEFQGKDISTESVRQLLLSDGLRD